MRIEFSAPIEKNNPGIEEIINLVAKKGVVLFDFKKGNAVIEDFQKDKLSELLLIIRKNFDIHSLSLNKQQKFKLRNDEKELGIKKDKLKEEIEKKPNTISSKVQDYILKEKVFTLTSLRTAFPTVNFTTLRSYVNRMKNEDVIIELERGKYAVR